MNERRGAAGPAPWPSDAALVLLRRAAAAAAGTATLESGATEVIAAVREITGWPVGYLLSSSRKGRPFIVSAWSTVDPVRFRVLRQVTIVSSGGRTRSLAAKALLRARACLTTDVGEAASAVGLALALAVPVPGPERPSEREPGPERPPEREPGPERPSPVLSAALVFLAEDAMAPDEGLVEVVSLAVSMLGRVVERRRADDAEEAIRAVVDGAGLAFVGLDEDALVTDWNGPAESLFGWSPAEARGRSLEQLVIPARLRAGGRSGLGNLRTEAGPAPGVVVAASSVTALPDSVVSVRAFAATDRSGREFAAELTLWPVPGPAGRVVSGVIRPMGSRSLQISRPRPDPRVGAESGEEAALRRGIEQGELRLVYQPIIRIAEGGTGRTDAGRIAGFEALVRWQHPQRGLLGPLEFIPLAEASGLIVPLGRHVLHEACRQASAWNAGRRPGQPLRISVNVSPHQLAVPHWSDEVAAVLDRSGLEPANLVLEITETAVMDDLDAVVLRLQELRRLGVRIAIDDFGTGHSSLSYLRTLPVDVLKIDKSFIDGIALGPHESALARAVIKLAATLRLDAVAEGVSDARQLAQLRRLRCPYGQGFLFSRPVSPAECADLLRAESRPAVPSEVGGGRGLDGVDDGVPVPARAAGHGHEVVDPEQ